MRWNDLYSVLCGREALRIFTSLEQLVFHLYDYYYLQSDIWIRFLYSCASFHSRNEPSSRKHSTFFFSSYCLLKWTWKQAYESVRFSFVEYATFSLMHLSWGVSHRTEIKVEREREREKNFNRCLIRQWLCVFYYVKCERCEGPTFLLQQPNKKISHSFLGNSFMAALIEFFTHAYSGKKRESEKKKKK